MPEMQEFVGLLTRHSNLRSWSIDFDYVWDGEDYAEEGGPTIRITLASGEERRYKLVRVE